MQQQLVDKLQALVQAFYLLLNLLSGNRLFEGQINEIPAMKESHVQTGVVCGQEKILRV